MGPSCLIYPLLIRSDVTLPSFSPSGIMKRTLLTLPLALCLVLTPSFAKAEDQAFTDIPPGHPIYDAAKFLHAEGIMKGYDDGSMKPGKSLARSEFAALITRVLADEESLAGFVTSPFRDVPDGVWFLKYVEYLRLEEIIDSPPKKDKFNGADPVNKVELLKILELAYGVDPFSTLGEIRLPLSSDVSSPDEWYYPFMRYAISASMTMIGTDGLLHPAQQLTRGDAALLLYRFLMYQQGRRTQALLSEAESEIIVILGMLEDNNIEQAEYASARALLAARGAHLKRPDEPIVQGAVKVTEAFRALVRAYRTGLGQEYEEVVKLAGDAWNLADRAKQLSPDLSDLTEQVQKIAKNMADSARSLMGQ